MFTSSGSMGGRGRGAKTIISPNTSFGDIMIYDIMIYGLSIDFMIFDLG